MQSVKRAVYAVSKDDRSGYEAFKAIGYSILKTETKEAILSLFQVLGGQLPLSKAVEILPASKALSTYSEKHIPDKWKACQGWVEWWTQPRHISKPQLFTNFSIMFYL